MRNRTCFHHAPYSTLLKYYLFLGEKYSEKQIIFSCPCDRNCPRAVFRTPHHQTVHAAEQALAGTCTYSNENPYVGVCFERKDGMPIEENIITKNNDFSLLNWFWEIVTNWWSKITGYFS